MKKIVLSVFTSIGMFAAMPLYATTPINQQALAPSTVTEVKHLSHLKDDSKVMLKGQVVKSLGQEKYEFRDSTGTVTIEIDDELWGGRALLPTQTITLIGEVDIDYKPIKRIEIDVDEVRFHE